MIKKIVAVIVLIIILVTLALTLKKKNNSNTLTLYGNIEIRQVDLSFQVGGKIQKMLKEEGDSIKKGELLAILDDKDYKTNLDKAIADVNKTLSIKKESEQLYKRNAPLCEAGAVALKQCETYLNNKNATSADYDSAIAQKNFHQNQLDYTKIYAPDEGIVIVRVQEEGATVNKGQIVYSISKTKPVWIRAYVNETDLGNIKYGMDVKVLTDTKDPKTGKLREYKGYIGYISPVAEFTPKTVQSTDLRTSLVYRIRVYVDDIDEFLRQGMPTTIKIDLTSGDMNVNGSN